MNFAVPWPTVRRPAGQLFFILVILLALLWGSASTLLAAINNVPQPFTSSEAAMMTGENNFKVVPLLTIGETLSGTTGALNPNSVGTYTAVGIPDGIGAYDLDADTVRVFINHELSSTAGYSYTVTGTLVLNGARISYFDINKTSKAIEDGGLAYNTIYDRQFNPVTSATQLDTPGFDRFCSASLFEVEQFGAGRGLANRIFFAGEETRTGLGHPHGGTEWALDVTTGNLWAVPAMGRGAWENVSELDTGTTTHVAFLMGDDTLEAPLYLYVGQKGAVGDGSFLDNNGLKQGQLYIWKSNGSEVDPRDFNGSGTLNGTWLAIDVQDIAQAGQAGHDAQGYKNNDTLQAEADALGGFSFSRPEDVSTNPADGTQAVLASTGRSSAFDGADSFGTVYLVDVDFTSIISPTASLQILYDGDADPIQALRSPDNLDWADDGYIYVQEDRSFNAAFGTGAVNPKEASIVRIDPTTGTLERVAEMDRRAVPTGQTDSAPTDVGNWESSGILDVTNLFGTGPERLYLFNVQAHSVGDGVIASANLVQGGQIALLVEAERVYLPLVVK